VTNKLPTPRNLREFFESKGHFNLVLYWPDVLKMDKVFQDRLVVLMSEHGSLHVEDDVHAVLPWSKLSTLTIGQLADLQEVIAHFLDVRGLIPFEEPCECGKAKGCINCKHTGKVTVYREMRESEQRLAENPWGSDARVLKKENV